MSRPLTPDTLIYGLTTAGDPQVSPDGTRLLYALARTDRETKKTTAQLWMCGIDGSAPRRLTWTGERNGGARWSPDGKTIAFISDRAVGSTVGEAGLAPTPAGKNTSKNTKTSGIFLLPVEGPGEARELTHHNQPISDLAWSQDGTRLAYTTLYDPENPDETERPEGAAPKVRVIRRLDYKQDNRGYLGDLRSQVFVVDAATGTRRRLTSELVDHWVPQWSPDGKTLAVQVRTPSGWIANTQLGLLGVASGELRRFGPEAGSVGAWGWSPSGDRIVFAGDTAQTSQLDFFVLDIASGAIRRLTDDLQCSPDVGFTTIAPPAPFVWLDDERVLFHGIEHGASGIYTLDIHTGAVERTQRWDATNQGLSTDAGRRYVAQAHASFERAGEISVYDRETDQTRIVTEYSAPVLADAPPATWERIEVRRGEFTIEAWLLKPPGFDPAKRYPVIMDVHGGPHGAYGYLFNANQQCLATNGFLVVMANPRGSGTYGRTFTQQVVRDWGGEDYRDLMAVLDHVLQRPYADPDRTGIYGYSYGGYMTAWTISQTQRFTAAVCGAPVFDMESMFGTSDIGYGFGADEFGGDPHEQREWYACHSPSTYAQATRTPTLIVHGEADDRCPIGQGEQMFVALSRAGCEVEFVRYPGGSHLFLRGGPAEHREDYYTRVLAWFKSHLGEPQESSAATTRGRKRVAVKAQA